MAKNRYKYNPETLSYETVKTPLWVIGLKFFGFLCAVAIFSTLVISASYSFFDSPNERKLRKDLAESKMQIDELEGRISDLSVAIHSLEKKDGEVYREIFDAPMPEALKVAGIGGSKKYTDLQHLTYGKSIEGLHTKLDRLSAKVRVQETSYDQLIKLAKQKSKKLASVPAIMPIPNKDLKRMASGYGYRIDPFYKTRKFHGGMDFTAPSGTEVHCTGDGVVELVETKRWGYGKNIIVDHGFGYKTRYAHLSKFKVRKGDKVTRGQVIGLVGSTGKSTAPHLHYEVIKGGNRQNPANYYYNDLTDEQYEEMIELSSHPNQSFD
ncbi:MAG: peptidoglycan DD-metalloendopeptidase family protein [Bacteroidia bacterium]|nr:peptidoglycan DD-metalloendopeptidase family protein [Bacteroidia bacterium]